MIYVSESVTGKLTELMDTDHDPVVSKYVNRWRRTKATKARHRAGVVEDVIGNKEAVALGIHAEAARHFQEKSEEREPR